MATSQYTRAQRTVTEPVTNPFAGLRDPLGCSTVAEWWADWHEFTPVKLARHLLILERAGISFPEAWRTGIESGAIKFNTVSPFYEPDPPPSLDAPSNAPRLQRPAQTGGATDPVRSLGMKTVKSAEVTFIASDKGSVWSRRLDADHEIDRELIAQLIEDLEGGRDLRVADQGDER